MSYRRTMDLFLISVMILLLLLGQSGCRRNEAAADEAAGSKQEVQDTGKKTSEKPEQETTEQKAGQGLEQETTQQKSGQSPEQETTQQKSAEQKSAQETTGQEAAGQETLTKEELILLYEKTRVKSDEINLRLDTVSMDQQSMNQAAAANCENWNNLLSRVWSWLKENLDQKEMEALTEEQREWSKQREQAVREAGKEMEGGSMQPFLEYSENAVLTRKRVRELMDTYVQIVPKVLVADHKTKSAVRMVKYLKKAGFEVKRVDKLEDIVVSDYDTLVIPGGHNITPELYGAERDKHTYGTDIAVDELQIEAVKMFAEEKKPVLGVCRGCQVVNVAFGGTIDQHIPGWHKKYRTVKIDRDSWLYPMLGTSESVYHYHHQCVDQLGEGLTATQWDEEDEHIEAIEHTSLPVYGIQWHPDSMGDRGVDFFKYYRQLVIEYYQ